MKKISWLILCCVLVTGVCLAAVGCQGEAVDKPTYLVEVEGGTGGGYYYGDVNCTVVAQVPEGKQFIKWVAGEKDMSAKATYVFTVKENIKLTAVFADDVDIRDLCTVDVKYGNGSGTFFAGTQRVLSVPEKYASLKFLRWEAVTTDADGKESVEVLSEQSTYTLTVEKNMNIVARYDAKLEAPGNERGQQFRIAANKAFEFDRDRFNGDLSDNSVPNRKTAFVDGVAYLLYYMYDSADEQAAPINTFKMVIRPDKTVYITDMEETQSQDLKGGIGDFYQDFEAEKDMIRKIIGIDIGNTYYFAVRSIAVEDTPYESSEISARGPGCTFTL